MNIRPLFIFIPLAMTMPCSGQDNNKAAPLTITQPQPAGIPNSGSISVQEMLVSGPTQLKMHSLAMISQNNVAGEIDESYLPGFATCAADSAIPLRSITAELLGKHFVVGKENPNPQAVTLLKKLAQDESAYVRYNAIYHGLTQITDKSDEIITLLINVASKDKEQRLSQRIAESLKSEHDRVAKILNNKLTTGTDIAIFEVYKELTGDEPPNADKYMEMPSSLPYLFVVKSTETPETDKTKLEKLLKDAGIENPVITISGTEENYVLLLKTYLTKDRLNAEKEMANHPELETIQAMWLTPEVENKINLMRK